jgi:eukaryotic-like serine/threonine-protein kinase
MSAGIPEGRHLAAVMFIDMVGYSARMQDNEQRAIAAVRGLWEVVRPLLGQHGGREVDLAGDGMLTEFPGALAAVRCALALHGALQEQNRKRPEAERIRVRCGLHLGDIEHRDGRIYGDGVNIAARVIGVAPAGAIAMTPHVRDQLLNALEEKLERLGTRTLKNIKAPLELWCIAGPECSAAELAAARKDDAGADRKWTFGTATLDERTLELTVAGRPMSLEKKALDVLLHLLQHAGEVVTKDELIEAAWPGRVISDSALTSCMTKLREALPDEAIKTVHGFGYRLSLAVKVESFAADAPPHFDFKPGDKPPLRPLWSLVERLGTGGHGEAWLARHDKTREPRVFKFALEASALASLKREITLYRVLKDSLGGRTDYVQLLDWNLEELPYFIESEFANGGNLVQWAEQQGGIAQIPLPRRLALIARIAEALAAAHSVGVLHKDLKPTNVLLHDAGGVAQVKLCDFGSGGVLDPGRLEQLGITRLGFTKTVIDVSDTTSGTPIYLAPEVISAQPFTARADIYSLGVMLYQMVAGNLHKPLAPAWELDVQDELLREDIAAAVHGDPEKRLPDASLLAQRLAGLDERRQRRADEAAARERQRVALEEAARAKARLERMRGRRVWTAGLMSVLIVGLAISLWQYRQAEEARKEAEVISRFWTHDVLSVANPVASPTAGLTVREMLRQAGLLIDARLEAQPRLAARVHYELGKLLVFQNEYAAARPHLEQAMALSLRFYGPGDLRTLLARNELDGLLRNEQGRTMHFAPEAEVVQRLRAALPDDHPYVIKSRALLLADPFQPGSGFEKTIAEMRTVVTLAKRAGALRDDETGEFFLFTTDRNELIGDCLHILRNVLFAGGRFAEALEASNGQISAYQSSPGLTTAMQLAFMQWQRGEVLRELGRLDEAYTELTEAERGLLEWAGADDRYVPGARVGRARTLLEMGNWVEARRLFDELLRKCSGGTCNDDWPYERLQATAGLLELNLHAGAFERALVLARTNVLAVDRPGFEPGWVVDTHVQLAEVLQRLHLTRDAWAALSAIAPRALLTLAPQSHRVASRRRIEGLLWLDEKEYDKARAALQEALEIEELRRGPAHWRARRLREELARVPAKVAWDHRAGLAAVS